MAYFLAQEEGGCEDCPLLGEGAPTRNPKVCPGSAEFYPLSLSEKSLSVDIYVESPDDLASACRSFTKEVFKELGRPGVDLHPRAFLRVVKDGRRRNFCASGWPIPTWIRLIIEQISFDTAGMQPRLLWNDKPWLAQPAIYTECYQIVTKAKQVAKDWADENKKAEANR